MKIIFNIEAAEKLVDSEGSLISGGNIKWSDAPTEYEAKKIGDKFLKDKDVLSVWIYKIDSEDNGDPIAQWVKYEGDKKWKGGNYWD
jgi:hypothetical protein